MKYCSVKCSSRLNVLSDLGDGDDCDDFAVFLIFIMDFVEKGGQSVGSRLILLDGELAFCVIRNGYRYLVC